MPHEADRSTETVRWIIQQLVKGRSRVGIQEELVDVGMTRDAASVSTPAIVSTLQRRIWWERAKRSVGSWAVIIGVFVLLNGVLYGIQEAAAGGKKQALAELELVMDGIDNEIRQIEAEARFTPTTPVTRARYDRLVEAYNAYVPEYNQLARAAHSRWWLLPIPGGRSASRSTHP